MKVDKSHLQTNARK